MTILFAAKLADATGNAEAHRTQYTMTWIQKTITALGRHLVCKEAMGSFFKSVHVIRIFYEVTAVMEKEVEALCQLGKPLVFLSPALSLHLFLSCIW